MKKSRIKQINNRWYVLVPEHPMSRKDGYLLEYRIDPFGFMLVYRPNHPKARKSGYILEHRLIMEDHLQRPLGPRERVLHKNGDTSDNSVSNLLLTRPGEFQTAMRRIRNNHSDAYKLIKERAIAKEREKRKDLPEEDTRLIDNNNIVLVWVPEHPNCTKRGYMLEHRLVIEEDIGRYLDATENIIHLNGIQSDNRLENLSVITPCDCPFEETLVKEVQ